MAISQTTRTYKILFLSVLIFIAAAVGVIYFYRPARAPITARDALLIVPPPSVSDDLGKESLLSSIEGSILYYKKLDPGKSFTFGEVSTTSEKILDSLIKFRELLNEHGLTEKFYDEIKENFRFFKSSADSVLFTGYFEASLRGSLTKDENYRYPIYKRPNDLVEVELDPNLYQLPQEVPVINRGRLEEGKVFIPYLSREDIDIHAKLLGKSLELLWTDDPVDLFFLHIQGSGRVFLKNGSMIRVGYADKNGHPYRAIGKYLIDRGFLKSSDVSMGSIKQFLRSNPEMMTEVFSYNPSYVFFRKLDKGTVGNIDVELTPYRSIATDAKLFPKGALALIETEKPIFDATGQIIRWERFTRFVLNQDTGGAIRGGARVDLFTGFGKEAEDIAGNLKHQGQIYFLLRR